MTSLLVRDRKELFAKAEDQTHDPLIAAAREVARENASPSIWGHCPA